MIAGSTPAIAVEAPVVEEKPKTEKRGHRGDIVAPTTAELKAKAEKKPKAEKKAKAE